MIKVVATCMQTHSLTLSFPLAIGTILPKYGIHLWSVGGEWRGCCRGVEGVLQGSGGGMVGGEGSIAGE